MKINSLLFFSLDFFTKNKQTGDLRISLSLSSTCTSEISNRRENSSILRLVHSTSQKIEITDHSISHLKYALKNFEKPENLTSSHKPNIGILTFCGGLVSSFAAFARQGKKQCCASGKMKRRERERREAAKLEWRRPSDFCSVEIGRREIRFAALRSACGNDARSSLFCRGGGLKRLKLDAHQFLCPCCLWVSRPERD